MNRKLWVRSAAWLCFAALWVLSACGGGGGSASPGAPAAAGPYAVGGTVSGLAAGSAVSLLNNGADPVALSANGAFTFASRLTAGSAYAVTVQSHTPGVACTVSNGSGTVGSAAVTGIAVSCAPGTARVLYSFDGSQNSVDGQSPSSKLVMDSIGNLYGTTQGGGTGSCPGGCGTVFQTTPSGVTHTLYSFQNNLSDGVLPLAGLVMDSIGNLYGTTYIGGVNGSGTVFKVSPSGSHTVLYSFGNGVNDGQNPYGGLAFDTAGNLYGTTANGGANNVGTVFKITPSAIKSTLYSFLSTSNDGQHPYGDLLIDSGGNIFGTTSGGGNGIGTVFKINTTGTETVLYSFDSTLQDGQAPYSSLVMDSAGNLYGTTLNGGAYFDPINNNDGGTIFKISSAGVQTVLYSFTGGVDGKQPYAGLVFDRAGNLYGTTSAGGANGGGTVFKITPSGAFTVLYAFGASASDGQSPQGGLVLDSMGNIYGTTVYGGPGGINGVGTVFKID